MILPPEGKKPGYHHGDLRNALLAAGEAELAQSGLAGFSLRKVAARAGVSHSAPAHHFGDMAGLIDALAVRGFDQLLAKMQAREATAPDDAGEPLVAAGLGYLDFAAAHPALFRLVFGTPMRANSSTDLRAGAARAYDHLAAVVASLPGAPDADDPALRAEVLGYWAQAHGFAELLLSGHICGDAGARIDDQARETLFREAFSRRRSGAATR